MSARQTYMIGGQIGTHRQTDRDWETGKGTHNSSTPSLCLLVSAGGLFVSVCLSGCLILCLCLSVSSYLYVCKSVCTVVMSLSPPLKLSILAFMWMYKCISVFVCSCISFCLSMYLSLLHSISVYVYLCLHLSLSLSASLSLWDVHQVLDTLQGIAGLLITSQRLHFLMHNVIV